MPELRSGDDQHPDDDRGDRDRRSDVGSEEDETERDRREEQDLADVAKRRLGRADIREDRYERDDQGELGELRRGDLERTDGEPALRGPGRVRRPDARQTDEEQR